jgi:hypothetical protein
VESWFLVTPLPGIFGSSSLATVMSWCMFMRSTISADLSDIASPPPPPSPPMTGSVLSGIGGLKHAMMSCVCLDVGRQVEIVSKT